MKSRLLTLVALAATASALNASIKVQELFDDISSGNASLNGAGDTATSIGMTGNWTTHVSNDINTADNFNVDGATLPGLPSNNGANGSVWNGTNSYGIGIYASRPLAAPIDFNTDQTIYFSVRLNNSGDSAMGIGLAEGTLITSKFVGAGFTWNNARSAMTGQNDSGNAAYISYGTLNPEKATVAGNVDVGVDGVYAIQTHEPSGSVNGYGLLVGRVTIKSSGADIIQIKRYAENETIDNNLDSLSWSATGSFDTSMSATQVLLWMNGNGTGQLDAIRFGSTWTDVTGVTLEAGQPGLSGASAGSITGTSAQASVNLFTTAANVTLYWDTVDQGTGSWTNSNTLGNKAVGSVTGAITGLAADTKYFYRFYAVNTTPNPDLDAWSEAGKSFATSLAGLAINDLNVDPYSALEVDLDWTDSFSTETGFIIQRSPAGVNTWTTVATVPADTNFYTDKFSGLAPDTAYDYRVFAANGAGQSDPSNIASGTTDSATPQVTQLLIDFNGSLNGTVYTLALGEVDLTATFKANGVPNVSGGVATINPGNAGGSDGFDLDPSSLGNLTIQNWVAEVVITYQAPASTDSTWVMDVQGDSNVRFPGTGDSKDLQLAYYNGSVLLQDSTPLPTPGIKVHLAYAWNAATAALTGYVNGRPFGTLSNGPFATPDLSNLSFGYLGRTGYEGRGIDGFMDAVAFQTGTTAFNPATDFLILPAGGNYASWIGGFPVGEQTSFHQDPDQDGMKNGIEAFFGTNPSTPSSGITQVSSNGTVTTFTHPQADPALNDVTGSYEWSLDLVNWYAGDGIGGPGGGLTVNIPLVAPVGGISTVTATASAPVGKLFIRVVANQ